MNIFGWNITRVDKKKLDESALDVFKSCVIKLSDSVTKAKKLLTHIRLNPDIESVQDLSQIQEEIESLVDIYCHNKFSKPAAMFMLDNVTSEMRKIFVQYATTANHLAQLKLDMKTVKMFSSEVDSDWGFSAWLRSSSESAYKKIMENIELCLKNYLLSLNAIAFTITYDSTRIETGVDIIEDYYKSKKKSKPKGLTFKFSFKKLTRDEIEAQVKHLKEENNNDPERNRI